MFPLNPGIPEQDESWAPSSTACSIIIGQSHITTFFKRIMTKSIPKSQKAISGI